MKRNFNLLCATAVLSALAGIAGAVENDYFPLIAESTYTYKSQFKGKDFQETWIVKSDKREETEYFYFLSEKEIRETAAFIGVNGIGRGVYLNKDGNISIVMVLMKSAVNATSFKEPIMMLKNPPEIGQKAEGKGHNGAMIRTWTVVGFEDVTVAAGTFKQCAKIEIEEIWPEHKTPDQRLPSGEIKPGTLQPEKKYKDVAWLAKGVGTVKWIRGTGRLDELAEFKIAETKK